MQYLYIVCHYINKLHNLALNIYETSRLVRFLIYHVNCIFSNANINEYIVIRWVFN